jgi:putative oxidoreductase
MIQFLFVFSDWALLALRIVLASILLAHGLPKIKDLKKNSLNFEKMGFKNSYFWGTVTALLETIGGLFLLIGFLTQIISILFIIEFLIILITAKRNTRFVNGVEFELIIISGFFILLTMGGSHLSLDQILGYIIY